MSVVRTVEEIGPCRKELVIEIPAPAVDAETERVVAEYRKHAKLPGFRPGKVPVKVVRQRFREEIDEEVVERLVPRYWKQAEAEKELEPLTQPQLAGVDDREEGGPLVFRAHVEVRPEIELDDLDGFELPEAETEPTDEEVDKALEELRSQAGDWVPVDRPAAQGDLVSVRVEETTDSGEDAAEGEEKAEPQTVEIEVGSANVWEELSLALTGRKEGQKGEFSRMHEEEEKVTERTFEFEVQAVKERELPELDDELASQFGDFESVDALRDAVRERLTAEKGAQSREQREKALLDQLRERHPLDMPKGAVDAEIEGMVREYAEGIARQGVDLENAGIDWRAMAEQARPMAEKRVHARLLLDAVAERMELEVTDEELEGMLAQIAQSQQASTAAVRRALDQDGRLADLKGQMRRSKAMRRLLGEEDVAPAASDDDDAAQDDAGDGGEEE